MKLRGKYFFSVRIDSPVYDKLYHEDLSLNESRKENRCNERVLLHSSATLNAMITQFLNKACLIKTERDAEALCILGRDIREKRFRFLELEIEYHNLMICVLKQEIKIMNCIDPRDKAAHNALVGEGRVYPRFETMQERSTEDLWALIQEEHALSKTLKKSRENGTTCRPRTEQKDYKIHFHEETMELLVTSKDEWKEHLVSSPGRRAAGFFVYKYERPIMEYTFDLEENKLLHAHELSIKL